VSFPRSGKARARPIVDTFVPDRLRSAGWHLAAGFVVGVAGSVVYAARAADLVWWLNDTPWPFAAVALCTPVVTALVVWLATPRSAPTWVAVLGPGALAPLAGIADVVASAVVTSLLAGRPIEWGQVGVVGLIVGLPVGTIWGLLFATPLGLAAWAARRGLAQPAGTPGAGAPLAAVTAIVLLGAMAFVGEARTLEAWFTSRATCAAVALGCLACAVRAASRSAWRTPALLVALAAGLAAFAAWAPLAPPGLPKICEKCDPETVPTHKGWDECPQGWDGRSSW